VESIRNLTDKQQTVIAVALLIVYIGLNYYLVFQPRTERLAELTDQRDLLLEQVKRLEGTWLKIDAIEAGIRDFQIRRAEIDAAVLDLPDSSQMLKDIHAAAWETGAVVNVLTDQGSLTKVGPYLAQTHSISVVGTYRQQVLFLSEIEGRTKWSWVIEFMMSEQEDQFSATYEILFITGVSDS